MPAIIDTALVHHHDDALTSTARLVATIPDRAEREAAAAELRRAFCAELRAARERKGLSLQAIADATKVSEGLFEGLERADLARWPTGIYRRAFFREYVAHIGMPGEATLSEFLRLFPEDLEQDSSEARVPGPLRLTLSGSIWRRMSPMHSQAAAIDLAIVLTGAAAVAWAGSAGFWASLGIVSLVYHALGTVMRGCSPGTWWIRALRLHSRMKTWGLTLALLALAGPAAAQDRPFEPTVGQPGKDVVWVPTPEVMVERMLDLAKVTPQDFVVDLGSGDGRNVIGAAKRGANALGVEYNPDMVALSKRRAAEAGVGNRAQFVEGDMFEADFSKANVLALFLLPSNMLRLRDKFLDLRPGSRIVSNTFSIQDWEADETVQIDECEQWCTAMLYIVPAKVGGTWRSGSDVLELKQEFQMLSGTLTSAGEVLTVSGQMRGTEISLKAGSRTIAGRVQGNQMDATMNIAGKSSAWRAARAGS